MSIFLGAAKIIQTILDMCTAQDITSEYSDFRAKLIYVLLLLFKQKQIKKNIKNITIAQLLTHKKIIIFFFFLFAKI